MVPLLSTSSVIATLLDTSENNVKQSAAQKRYFTLKLETTVQSVNFNATDKPKVATTLKPKLLTTLIPLKKTVNQELPKKV
jgi:hypothetical protein